MRQDAQLTIEDVAERLLCSQTKVSRMETGERTATLRDIRDLLQIYEITSPVVKEELNTLAREARQRGWWQNYDDLGEVTRLIDLQTEAISITEYQSSIVPGLLQTEDYAKAVIRGVSPRMAQDVLEERTTARMARQQMLKADHPPRLWFLLDEPVLHHQVGGPSVLAGQLEKLLDAAASPGITVQVIRYDAGSHPGLSSSSFTFLEFKGENASPVVYIEGLAGELYLERESDIDRCREAIEYLRAVALSPRESEGFIKKIIERGL
jgi:transcriptional regulator with XRE-family HTH domain